MASSDSSDESSPNPNDRVLTYGDATLLRSDLDILRGPHYLNDRLLHFYFSHLSSTPSSPPSLLLIPPAVSFLVANFPAGDPAELLGPVDLSTKGIVLFPVNDNEDVTVAEGGSHWSLLVCCVGSREFVHHDSSVGRVNSHHARALGARLSSLLGGGGRFKYEEGPTPCQTNGYDCGLYVLAIAKCLCEWYSKVGSDPGVLSGKEKWFGLVKEQVTGDKVHALRGELLSLILGLAQQTDSNK